MIRVRVTACPPKAARTPRLEFRPPQRLSDRVPYAPKRSEGSLSPRSVQAASQVRRRCLCRRRQGVQSEDPRHRGYSGHHEHRNPSTSTRVATDARGKTVDLPQIDRPACPAARAVHVEPGRPCDQRGPAVGDHRMSRLATSCSFQRSMTAFASARAAASATCRLAPMAMSRPRVRTPMRQYCLNRAEPPPPPLPPRVAIPAPVSAPARIKADLAT
jgi:hypothetical protein